MYRKFTIILSLLDGNINGINSNPKTRISVYRNFILELFKFIRVIIIVIPHSLPSLTRSCKQGIVSRGFYRKSTIILSLPDGKINGNIGNSKTEISVYRNFIFELFKFISATTIAIPESQPHGYPLDN